MAEFVYTTAAFPQTWFHLRPKKPKLPSSNRGSLCDSATEPFSAFRAHRTLGADRRPRRGHGDEPDGSACRYAARGSAIAKGFYLVAALVSAQAVWGVLTLINAAPLPVALVHQGLGVVVLLGAVWLVWITRSENNRTVPA